jgi:predicted nucleic acid-binding protein
VEPAYFADTSFWIGLSSRRDQFHAVATDWARYLARRNANLVTTEAVLWEWLNAMATSGTRITAAEGYRHCHTSRQIEVVPFIGDGVKSAIGLYRDRADKDWSLTDCLSFSVSSQRKITRALTSDRHFQQAGLRCLLLEPAPAN